MTFDGGDSTASSCLRRISSLVIRIKHDKALATRKRSLLPRRVFLFAFIRAKSFTAHHDFRVSTSECRSVPTRVSTPLIILIALFLRGYIIRIYSSKTTCSRKSTPLPWPSEPCLHSVCFFPPRTSRSRSISESGDICPCWYGPICDTTTRWPCIVS